jgi:hypothetical protein
MECRVHVWTRDEAIVEDEHVRAGKVAMPRIQGYPGSLVVDG